MKTTEISREELHDLIWEKPMSELAKELGISDVGLKKLCRRNGIPTPPQGYHLMGDPKKKKKLIRALPQRKQGQEENFRFFPSKISERKEPEMEAAWTNILDSVTKVSGKQKREAVALIRSVRKNIDKRKVDERGIVRVPATDYPLRTSPAMLDAAMELLEALLLRLCELGASNYRFEIEDEYRPRYYLKIDWLGFSYSIRIEETSKRVEKPKNEWRKGFLDHWYDKYEYQPKGKLELTINPPGLWITAKDGRSKIIERIEGICRRMADSAHMETMKLAAEKIRRNKALEKFKRKDLNRREKEFETSKQEYLGNEMEAWKRARDLREYVLAVEQAGYLGCKLNIESEREFEKWLAWAKTYIESLDPIKSGNCGAVPSYPEEREFADSWRYF